MNDSEEKLTALKKAYADVVLNTTKEAAAKILSAERRARECERALVEAREDSLRMLNRMKQIMEQKVAEVETTSSKKSKRIEDLEVQLHESENALKDHKTEIKMLRDELDKIKKIMESQVNSLDEQIVKGAAASQLEASQMNGISTSGAILLSSCERGPGSLSTYDIKNTALNQREVGSDHFTVSENTTRRTDPSDDFPSENDMVASPKDGDMQCQKRISLEEVMQQGISFNKRQAVAFFSKFTKRKSRSTYTYKNPEATSCTNQVIQAYETSTLSRCSKQPCPGNGAVESGENLPDNIEEENRKNFISSLVPLLSLDKVVDSEPVDGTESKTEDIKESTVPNAAEEDTALTSKLQFVRQNSEDADTSGFPVCEPNLETSHGAATKDLNDKLLKYTRKRKRGSMSCPDANGFTANIVA